MKYYLDVEITESSDITLNYAASRVFYAIHMAMGLAHSNNIAATFPHMKRTSMGNLIRLFSNSKETLEGIDVKKFLKRYSEFVNLSSLTIKTVPEGITKYSIYSRVHQKSSPAVRAKRFASRHSKVDYNDALKFYKPTLTNGVPYFQMKSSSNGHHFSLFIKKTIVDKDTDSHTFNSYGLSCGKSAAPEF